MRIYYSKNYSGGHELLRQVMIDFEGLPENLKIMREKSGKPYLLDYPEIYFSIRHTNNIWLCAVDRRPMGLDCELADRRVLNPLKLAKRFFTDDETKYISQNVSRDVLSLSVSETVNETADK